jgi:hypothetical protein
MFRNKQKSKISSISAPFDTKKEIDLRKPIKTSYSSNLVEIPADFLKVRTDAEPIQVERANFATSTLPEYAPYYATVLDNVLSAAECAELLRLAVLSSPTGSWAPALLNVGAGVEILETDVRHCDRIIWDEQEVVNRIWDRCLLAEGIREDLGRIEKQPSVQGQWAADRDEKWRMVRVNERMRFLKYGAGNYFKSHCDGTYITPSGDQRSFYTLHLYLNDSVASGGDLKGGATTFHSRDRTRRLDVDPKMGRVLIFQHAHLVHSGDEVQEGIKYTMRSDLMYERIMDEDDAMEVD